MALEVLGGLVAEELDGVAALDQGHALGDEAFQFDRADFRAILIALAALLRLLVVVEFALDALVARWKRLTRRPQQVLEIGFETGVAQRRDQGVEDVGDGVGDGVRFRQRSAGRVRPGRGDSHGAGVR